MLVDVPREVRRELWLELEAEFGKKGGVNRVLIKQARLRAATAILAAVAELSLNEQRSVLRFVNDIVGQANKRWSRG